MANKYTNNPYRKENRVKTSGKGRTARWPHNTGVVCSVITGHSVEVFWDDCKFVTDEMELDEIMPEEK